jgi:hypothetical protein
MKELVDKKRPNVRNQIYKEISLSLKLNHNNVIKIFDYHSIDHKVCLTLFVTFSSVGLL